MILNNSMKKIFLKWIKPLQKWIKIKKLVQSINGEILQNISSGSKVTKKNLSKLDKVISYLIMIKIIIGQDITLPTPNSK